MIPNKAHPFVSRGSQIFGLIPLIVIAGCLLVFECEQISMAKTLTIHVGPPSIGAGGSNPVSIPPIQPVEYEIVYVTDKDREWSVGLVPGILYGTRFYQNNFYVGIGGGLVISVNGGGPGIYSSFGVNLGQSIQFNFEFKKAIGLEFSSTSLVSPYALRMGVTFPL